jgi:hypothetical protein
MNEIRDPSSSTPDPWSLLERDLSSMRTGDSTTVTDLSLKTTLRPEIVSAVLDTLKRAHLFALRGGDYVRQ